MFGGGSAWTSPLRSAEDSVRGHRRNAAPVSPDHSRIGHEATGWRVYGFFRLAQGGRARKDLPRPLAQSDKPGDDQASPARSRRRQLPPEPGGRVGSGRTGPPRRRSTSTAAPARRGLAIGSGNVGGPWPTRVRTRTRSRASTPPGCAPGWPSGIPVEGDLSVVQLSGGSSEPDLPGPRRAQRLGASAVRRCVARSRPPTTWAASSSCSRAWPGPRSRWPTSSPSAGSRR